MSLRRYTYYELSDPIPPGTVSYYICDTEEEKPDPQTCTVGDQAFVRQTKKLYVADGEWLPFG